MRQPATPHSPGMPVPGFSDSSVREVLGLRRWALGLFAERGRAVAPPPRCTAGSWAVFLYTERCALPLSQRLASDDVRLPPDVATVLESRARIERARVECAREQLRELGALVRRASARVVILKGGAYAASGGMLDLGDLDLLSSPESANDIQSGMQAMGYVRIAGHQDNPQRRLARETGIPVELHVRSSYGVSLAAVIARSVALDAAFYRLAPPDHLAHLLLHGVREYGRVACIRELLLLAAAIGACEPAERARITGELASHPRARAITALYEMALGLWNGTAPAARFADAAAIRCFIAAEGPRMALPRRFQSRALATAVALLDGGIGWTGAMRTVFLDLDARSPTVALDWLLRTTPRLGRVIRGVGRSASFALSAPTAVRLARRAQRLANAAAMLGA